MTGAGSSGRRPIGSVRRRDLLAAGAGALTLAVAGCTRASEFLVDRVVGDVNVFNTTGRRVTGSLSLVDPDEATVLDEELTLAAADDGDEEPAALFEDTLTTAGTYRFAVGVATIGDEREDASVRRNLEVPDPDEEMIVVFLGREYTDELVTITVVEDFSELEATLEG